MNIPREFASRLEREFRGRLRIRWSNREGEFQIEQKVARGLVVSPIYVDDYSRDDHIRARDGYMHVMSIRPGDRMPCPDCGTELKVPIHEIGTVICPYCRVMGREGKHIAGFFPLTDLLLDHLRKIDPELGASEELAKNADRKNKALLDSLFNDARRKVNDGFDHYYNKLTGIPSVGYTGREFK